MNSIPAAKIRYPFYTSPVAINLGIAVLLYLSFEIVGPLCFSTIEALGIFEVGRMGTPSYNSSEETKQILTVIALIIIAMGFIFWLLRRAAGQLIQRRQLSEISRLARSPIEMHDSNGRDWGIAIAGDKLYVVDDQVVGSIPLTAIRQVSWKISGYDVTIYRGSSILKAFISSVSNKRSEKGAALTSGLSITVDDPSQPVWFFRCTNEMVLRRWNNIITQAIARGEVKLEAA